MSKQQFGKVSGNEKWHRRLGHTTKREIHDTILFVKGLEELVNKVYLQMAVFSPFPTFGKTLNPKPQTPPLILNSKSETLNPKSKP